MAPIEKLIGSRCQKYIWVTSETNQVDIQDLDGENPVHNTLRRVKRIKQCEDNGKPDASKESIVIYWMIRELRTKDNFGLHYAQLLAEEKGVPLIVYYSPYHSHYPNRRYIEWRIKGLVDVQSHLEELKIPFISEVDLDRTLLKSMLQKNDVVNLVTDFFPLREVDQDRRLVQDILPTTTSFDMVDSHNVVPCWICSPKHETYAFSLRKKIEKWRNLFKFSQLPPPPKSEMVLFKGLSSISDLYPCALMSTTDAVLQLLSIGIKTGSPEVHPIEWAIPGMVEGEKRLIQWVTTGAKGYNDTRNDPNADSLSHFSIYFNHGFISPQRALWEVSKASHISKEDKDGFIDEACTWRELSDNLTYYEPNYDNYKGWLGWAQETHEVHASDKRAYIYSCDEFEQAQTHDALWNSAQRQLLALGKIHGYMRIYWCKMILEWSPNAKAALEIAIFLNDKWSLDGCDPNSYNGVMWSIGGTHDRGWGERDVFGKIRCSTLNGQKRKFDVDAFIAKMDKVWEIYNSPNRKDPKTGVSYYTYRPVKANKKRIPGKLGVKSTKKNKTT